MKGNRLSPPQIVSILRSHFLDKVPISDLCAQHDMHELEKVASMIREKGHSLVIDKWLRDFPPDQHEEAWLISQLFLLLDHADISWE